MKTANLYFVVSMAWLAGCGPDASAPLAASDVSIGSGSNASSLSKGALGARMSPAGQLARKAVAGLRGGNVLFATRQCVNTIDCPEDIGFQDDPTGTQSEVAISADRTGKHVVIGFNDFRGFSVTPPSVSGFFYSDDGGKTIVDGGQLPSTGSDGVFGDPDIKYLGACTFVYSSILIKGSAQTMGIHRSIDCGHTWQGPFEITPATIADGAADKEFIDVDPETGRVLISWTNFGATAVEISTTYSDDVLTGAPPTWSPRKIIAADVQDGQGSVPSFAGNGSNNAYVVWTRFPQPGIFRGLGSVIGFSRSTDNGATWSAPVDLSAEFFTMDHVLGNDRVHTFPGMAVDNSRGHHRGNIYVVYANNNSHDGADVYIQRSLDGGLTFSPPLALNSRPGADRAQWFPAVTVDRETGRVYVFYLDQGIAKNGDLTDTSFTFSDDGGSHFSPPVPLTNRPFHAGWGNDTSQPNLGDYNHGVALRGQLLAAFGATSRPPAGFADGQPKAQFTVPDVFFRRTSGGHDEDDENAFGAQSNTVPLALSGVTFTDSGGNGNIDPGDTVHLKLNVRNYVTNLINARRISFLFGHLSSKTPGVTVVGGGAFYPSLDPGASATNLSNFTLKIAPGFVPGTLIELELRLDTLFQGSATLRHTLFTGTPAATSLLSENFDGAAPGTLPTGWTAVHGLGTNTVPWTTRTGFCGGSNAAFHTEALDGPTATNNARFERLFSPAIAIPAASDYVTLEFDVCYNTEDDPNFDVLAYDGFFLRIADLTTGRTLRSVLVEAFEDELTTGDVQHYPKHLPRGGGNYFQDMSAWAGASAGVKHVRMRLPGMAGSKVQLRFEFTQDDAGLCTDAGHPGDCGVAIDNLVMKNVVSVKP